jgi:hypothetical protein
MQPVSVRGLDRRGMQGRAMVGNGRDCARLGAADLGGRGALEPGAPARPGGCEQFNTEQSVRG